MEVPVLLAAHVTEGVHIADVRHSHSASEFLGHCGTESRHVCGGDD